MVEPCWEGSGSRASLELSDYKHRVRQEPRYWEGLVLHRAHKPAPALVLLLAAAEARQAAGQARVFAIWSRKGMAVAVQAIGLGNLWNPSSISGRANI